MNLVINSTQCTYVDFDCDVNTGLGGREQIVNWVAAAPLPSPFFQGNNGNAEPRDFLPLYESHSDSARISPSHASARSRKYSRMPSWPW